MPEADLAATEALMYHHHHQYLDKEQSYSNNNQNFSGSTVVEGISRWSLQSRIVLQAKFQCKPIPKQRRVSKKTWKQLTEEMSQGKHVFSRDLKAKTD